MIRFACLFLVVSVLAVGIAVAVARYRQGPSEDRAYRECQAVGMTPKQVAAWNDWAATDNLDADQLREWWFVAFGEDRWVEPARGAGAGHSLF